MMNSFDEEARVRALRDAVATLEPPQLRDDAFARISARRARGERIVLMVSDAPIGGRVGSRGVLAMAFAAAAALVIAAVIVRRGAVVSETSMSDRKSTRLNSSHPSKSRMPSSA